MNYPAASYGVSDASNNMKNHVEANFGVWTREGIQFSGGDLL
jgi:hypothetical protein